MKIAKVAVVLSVVLALLVVLPGCAQKKMTAEEILTKTVDATAGAKTVKFDMDTTMTIKVTGGSSPGEIEITLDGSGAADYGNQEMQMNMDMSIQVPQEDEQKMGLAFLIVGDWVYIKLAMLKAGDYWVKTKKTEQNWQSLNSLQGYNQLLAASTKGTLLADEKVDGTACYVVDMTPTLEAVMKWLGQQTMPGAKDIGSADLLSDMFKKLSYTCWIAKDSYLMRKATVHFLLEASGEKFGGSEDEALTMTMDATLTFRDYNLQVPIELPQEALDAEEVEDMPWQ